MSNYGPASAGNIELEKVLNGLSKEANGVPATTGNVYFVIPSSDSNYDEFYNKYQKTYSDGTMAVHNTIASAYSDVTTNRHDIIMLSANSAHAQTSMLSIAKNRVHFVGMSMRGGGFGMGARTRITMGVTTAATDLAVLQNTGVGNTFRNLKFDNANTKDESLYAVVEAGEYAIYENCEFYMSSQLDDTNAAELAMNGDSSTFNRCWIGSSIAPLSGDVVHPCMLLTKSIVAGKYLVDSVFNECVFARMASNVNNRFVYGANATDVNRMLWFKGCMFFNNPQSGVTPALVIDMAAAQTHGAIVVDQNCIAVDVTLMGTTGEGTYTLAPTAGVYATSGLSEDAD